MPKHSGKQNNSLICTKCGTTNPPNGRFCMKCGRALGGASTGETVPLRSYEIEQPTSLIERLWFWFRQQHIGMQIAAWLFLWWVLIPLLIWRTPWRTGVKAVLTVPFALIALSIITPNRNSTPRQPSQPVAVASVQVDTTGQVIAAVASPKSSARDPAASSAGRNGATALLPSAAPTSTLEPTVPPTAIPTLEPTVTPTVGPPVAQAAKTANIRNYPSTDTSDVIGKVQSGDIVTLESKTPDGGWYEVSTSSGAKGYISAALLTVAPDVVARVAAEDAGPPPVKPTPRPQTAQTGNNCDPNYSGACIPLVNYDLDCGDVGFKNFRVVGSDVHRFDRDKDGIACES